MASTDELAQLSNMSYENRTNANYGDFVLISSTADDASVVGCIHKSLLDRIDGWRPSV